MTLEQLLPGIKKNILLKDYTTFRIGGKARYFFVAKTKDDLAKAVRFAQESKLPIFILGAGSNLLVSDKGFNGLVIKMQNTKYEIQNTKISTGTGESLSKLIELSLKEGLGGLEWGSGIPGTVGGSIRGNAGAFGLSMSDVVESVEALDVKDFKFKTYNFRDCQFSYRQSVFKRNKNLIVFSATFKLKKEPKEKIMKEINDYLSYRRERHPKEPSAGSVFKNIEFSKSLVEKFPEFLQFKEKGYIPAAFLIAQCGLAGKTMGGAKISEMHSNFILNFKKARAQDVISLINLAKQEVEKKFNIKLEEEIEYLGF